MTDKQINLRYSEICSHLAARRLKPAFDLLGNLITENSLGLFNDEYRNLEETYQFMLKYTVEGITDPERQKVYLKLIISVYDLADKINEAVRLKFSPSFEFGKKRNFREQLISNIPAYLTELGNSFVQKDFHSEKTSGAAPEMNMAQMEKTDRLFYHIWFIDRFDSGEVKALLGLLQNLEIPVYYRSYIITSISLSLQRYFDTEKFNLLFEAYNISETEINQRALISLLINLYKYDSRMLYYPAIIGRLKILNENANFKINLERIIVQFIRSKETEKLQQRIRDEFLPEMIKISPNLKNKIDLDSLMAEGLTEDRNPDWEEILKDSPGLLNKIEEFSELQMKGSDVFMGSFAMLKSFPFFSEAGNWFIPFFPDHPGISRVMDTAGLPVRQMVEAIAQAPLLCNSDKYSFCFSIQRLPNENLEFMTNAMKAELEQINELRDDEVLVDPARKAEFVSNQYIQDLYRFYKLFPQKNDFEDVFAWRFDFHNKLALGDILKEDPRVLRNIAEFYFAKNQLEEAVEIFDYLLEQEKNGELYQKSAWCYQKMGEFEKALDGYKKAELYDVNRLWNLKKIALCYRNLKQPGKALKHYKAAEKLDPDNLANQLNIGHCLLELNEFEEALKCYFKVEYLQPGNKNVWRPIAWCSFLTDKKEQSEKYYLKLMEDGPGKHDFMNMGHIYWSLGNRKTALEYYQKSISKTGFSEKEFLQVFEEDLPHLLNQGVDKDDVPIMLDQLRYFLEE